MSEHGKGIIGSQRWKLWWQGGRGGSIAGKGGVFEEIEELDAMERVRSLRVEELIGVVNSLLGEIPRDVMGERGGDMMGLSGGPVWYSVGGDRFWYGGEMG
ncbi:hypothetical protein Tco_1146450 [Tanacetum coccineum]